MNDRSTQRQELIDWYEKMLACVAALTPEERAEFDKWDHERPDGVASSDWPGFENRIGKRPS